MHRTATEFSTAREVGAECWARWYMLEDWGGRSRQISEYAAVLVFIVSSSPTRTG